MQSNSKSANATHKLNFEQSELLRMMEQLQYFAERGGYPLAELMEHELIYYKAAFLDMNPKDKISFILKE